MLEIIKVPSAEATKVASLARPIWRQHYEPIIGSEQVEYMLAKFQSESAIQSQIAQGYRYYLANLQSKPAGYLAIEKRESTMFISKFYLAEAFRGQGLAKPMLSFIREQASKQHCQFLELTVNKTNPAYKVYLKLGFENVEAIQIDIGNGYIMDDYRMRLMIS